MGLISEARKPVKVTIDTTFDVKSLSAEMRDSLCRFLDEWGQR